MKFFGLLVLCGVVAFVSASETTMKIDPENLVTSTPETPTEKPTTTSTVKPEPTSEKPKTTTTTATTTTSEKPTDKTTSTAAPTTAKPTEKPTTTPTTTPAPTTTPTPPTPPAPTTPPTPPTPPAPTVPDVGTWSLNYTNGNITTNFTCMTVQVALQTEVHYTTKENKTAMAFVNLPKNATVTGSCNQSLDTLLLTWGNNSVEFSFRNESSKFNLNTIKITLGNATDVPNAAALPFELRHNHTEFNTTMSKSYKCDKIQDLQLIGAENKTVIHVSHVRMQAFTNLTEPNFQQAEDCEPFDTPDVVPIAVGCSLVILVLLVLAAYLIGRRRREGRGYLSMFTEHKREEDYIPMKNLSCFS